MPENAPHSPADPETNPSSRGNSRAPLDVRTVVLLMLGGVVVYLAHRDPVLGSAIAAGVAVVLGLHSLMER